MHTKTICPEVGAAYALDTGFCPNDGISSSLAPCRRRVPGRCKAFAPPIAARPRVSPRRLVALLTLALVAACGTNDALLPIVPTLDEQGADGFASVTTGRDHSCAIDTAGAAYCWGGDFDQQLGHPPPFVCDTVSHIPCSIAAQPVSTALRFLAISAGARHTCAIAADFSGHCWGTNDDAALGSPGGSATTPRAVGTALHFSTITSGFSHTCAVAIDGTAFCWGRNDRGQLGTRDTLARATPTPVATTARFIDLSAGQARTCGRTTDGAVLCWGAIWEFRDAGLEFTRAQLEPQAVPGATTLTAISVGAFTTCGITGGAAVCWEANPHGEFGNGTTDGSTTPRSVAGSLTFVSIAAGIIQTCGVANDGAAYCWGNNSFGQLGVSPAVVGARCSLQQLPCALTPVRVIGWHQFGSISTGLGNHVCAVTRRTNVYCWGLANHGQLGFGRLFGATSQPLRVVMARS